MEIKYKLWEGDEDEEILILNKEDINFIFAYEKFDYASYGGDLVIKLLKKMFEGAKKTYSINDKTLHTGYFLSMSEIGEKIDNHEFVDFVMWKMHTKDLLDYGIGPSNMWCHYHNFYEKDEMEKNYGFILIDYFRKHDIEQIMKMTEVDECTLKYKLKEEY